jgi:hypothetical protein
MDDRPIRGSTDWKSYSIVPDVPAEAAALAYGILLRGAGQSRIELSRHQSGCRRPGIPRRQAFRSAGSQPAALTSRSRHRCGVHDDLPSSEFCRGSS